MHASKGVTQLQSFISGEFKTCWGSAGLLSFWLAFPWDTQYAFISSAHVFLRERKYTDVACHMNPVLWLRVAVSKLFSVTPLPTVKFAPLEHGDTPLACVSGTTWSREGRCHSRHGQSATSILEHTVLGTRACVVLSITSAPGLCSQVLNALPEIRWQAKMSLLQENFYHCRYLKWWRFEAREGSFSQ